MAIIFNTATDLNEEAVKDPDIRLWVYNGLDCCATGKVWSHPDIQQGLARPGHRLPYKFVRAMQGPALDMMLRGVCVNQAQKMKVKRLLEGERAKIEGRLNRLAQAVWNRDLSPNSPKQLQLFFYGALGLPTQYAIRKTPEGKVRTPSCDHKALETLAKIETKGPGIDPYDRAYQKVRIANPFVKCILAIREFDKKITTLNQFGTRFRFAVNVVGTKTGRWSTQKDAFGEGGNSQNITDEMRRPLCADEGWKLWNADLKQAESRWVAALVWQSTGDDTYWKVCESVDLHTIVCTMSWTEEFKRFGQWNNLIGAFEGDIKGAKAAAKKTWYRHLSFRDGSKRIGHGSNYWGTPMGIAMMIGDIEVRVVRDFQSRYFRAFPAIPKWHANIIRDLQTTNELWTPLGRRRIFFGRTNDDHTLKEAMAHIPQSCNGELLNAMLYRVWRYGIDGGTVTTSDGRTYKFRKVCQLLLQVHDSFVWQSPSDDPALDVAITNKILEIADIPIPFTRQETGETRDLRIPLELKCGWNWSNADPDRETFDDGNPDGLIEWESPASDTRTRQQPARSQLTDWLD